MRSIATTYTIINLDPFTKYVVSITGQTIADEGMPSSEVEMRTGFGGETREGDYNSFWLKLTNERANFCSSPSVSFLTVPPL